jgi:hypothetical protein
MQGIWDGTGWQWIDAAALLVVFALCSVLATKIFRWG